MIYPQSFEQKIGFDQIRQKVQEKCVTLSARELFAGVEMMSDFGLLSRELSKTAQLQFVLQWDTSYPEVRYVDVLPFLSKLQIEGYYLEQEEFFSLNQCLESAFQLLSYFRKVNTIEGKAIDAFADDISELEALPQVQKAIALVIDDKAKVRDHASKLLQEIRRKIREKESSVQSRLSAILKKAQQDGIVEEGVELSVREGRVTIPVLAGSKRKIKGLVFDESATGKTVYVEPLEIVELNNQIKELQAQEHREIIRILIALTSEIAPYYFQINALAAFLTRMDLLRAKALYAGSIGAVLPYLRKEPFLDWKKARHPILEASLRKEKREIVPLDIRLSSEKHIILISGPNAGGKSVCLKTVGLLQYMLQCGLLIPVSELSEAGIFEDIFIDIGDEQSLENDLSTYSSHLQNMKHCLKHAGRNSLVLIDEFGTGTEPTAGGAIAEAVLAEFVHHGVFGVITTHYANLKYYASEQEGVMNGAMLFDEREIKPLFKLELGYPGSSFALEIARKTGLPEQVLTKAKEKMGDQYVGLEKQLREVSKNRRYWEEKRQRIQKADAHVEQLEQKYEKELSSLQQEKQAILKLAKQEAAALIKEANRQIEQTIRQIRESEAEKERTKALRLQLKSFQQEMEEEAKQVEDGIGDSGIEAKMKAIQARQEKRAQRKASRELQAGETVPPNGQRQPKPEVTWQIGAKVKMLGQQVVGEIVKMDGKKCVVAFGTLMSNLRTDQLELISASEYKKNLRQVSSESSRSRFDLGGKRMNFKPTLDVRGTRAAEALLMVENYLDEAVMLGMQHVSILHGTGTGILKEQIRNLLRTLPYVEEYKDEKVELGGAGITLITLNV